MIPQISDSYPPRYARTMADLADPSRALIGLAERNPELPAALVTVSWVYPRRVEVQLRRFEHVEPWREALGVDPVLIDASAIADSLHLQFAAPVDGIEVRVYVLGPVGIDVAPLAPQAVFPPRGGHANPCAYAAGMSSDCTCGVVEAVVEVAA